MPTTADTDADAAAGTGDEAPEPASTSGATPGSGEDIDVIEPSPAAPVGRNRIGVLTGLVVFVYALFLAAEIIVAGSDHRLYNRLHEIQGNVFARVALGVVVLCALFHGLNGLRLLVADRPAAIRHDAALRSVVAFATFALGIPAAAVILWPSVSEVLR
jgi:succinate dehydrogenase/fumarate reductase cytochrome b subunit